MKKLLFLLFYILINNFSNVCGQNLTIGNSDLISYFRISDIYLYHFIIEKDGVSTPKDIVISITGLSKSGNCEIIIKDAISLNTVYKSILLTSNASGNIQYTINSNIFSSTSTYLITVNDYGNSKILTFQKPLLVIEKVKTITINGYNIPYELRIHYCESHFLSHNPANSISFITNLSKVINDSWAKEITEWDLCKGTPNNIPIVNAGQNIDFVVHNLREYYSVLNQDMIALEYPNTDQKKIFITHSILKDLNSKNITEQEVLEQTISHEFFHCIQFSHVKFSTMISDYVNRGWLFEGQAKFLETVFMKYYTTTAGATNIAYSLNTADFSYQKFCSDFINHALDQNYSYKSLQTMGYEYALFWRHLYEHNTDANTSDKNKLAILPATCKAYGTANVLYIKIETFKN